MTTKPLKQMKVTVPKAKPVPRYIYVGPTFPGNIVQEYAVFMGTKKPDFLKEQFDKYPLLEHLIINVTDFPAALKELKKQGSRMHTLRAKMTEQFQKVGE